MEKHKLTDVLEEVSRPEEVAEDKEYNILGVRWYAEGVWIKKTCLGSEIKAKKMYRVCAGDLIYNRLFAWKGSFAVIPLEYEGCYVSNEFPTFIPKDGKADVDYIFMLLAQPTLWESIERQSTGVASISRNRLKVPDFLGMQFPIPDKKRQTKLYHKYSIVKAETSKLAVENQSLIDNVDTLRQAILQLAFMGKLVPQNSKEQPAKTIIEEIQRKKHILTKSGKLANQKTLRPIDEDEIPHTVPDTWLWARLGDIADIKGGITKDQKKKYENGRSVPYLRVANVQRGYLDLSHMKDIHASEEIIETLQLQKGDILFTEGGDLDKLGRGCVWHNEIPECIHQNHIFRARLYHDAISSQMISWFGNSLGREYFMRAGKQTTNLASVNLTKLRNFPVPIIPKEEQKRIVAKVDALMALCDRLQQQIDASRTHAEQLTASTLHHLLAG